MPAELTRRELWGHRRSLTVWVAGIVGYVALIAAIFPSIEGSPELDELIESYPDVLKNLFGLSEGGDITSGPGYLDAELFSFMLPLLVLAHAIGAGARVIAGEEDAGRLELLLAYPVRRRDFVGAKAVAVAASVALVCAGAGLALVVCDPIFGLELELGNVIQAVAGLFALGLFYGWLALAVGAAVPSRALAIGIPAGGAALAYLVNGLHGLAGWLDPFRVLSPFWLVGSSPLQNGVDELGTLAVIGAAVLTLVAGAALLERRDLATP